MFSKLKGGAKKGELSDIVVSAGGLITAAVSTSGYLKAGTKKTKQLTVQAAKTVTPGKNAQTAVASGRYTTGAVKVAAIPQKYVDLAKIYGYTDIAKDTLTFTSHQYMANRTYNHSLGKQPRGIIICRDMPQTANNSTNFLLALVSFWAGGGEDINSNRPYIRTYRSSDKWVSYQNGSNDYINDVTNETFKIYSYGSDGVRFEAGVEYTLITMA